MTKSEEWYIGELEELYDALLKQDPRRLERIVNEAPRSPEQIADRLKEMGRNT